ncbi:WASH complex subunit 2A isoform X2 [Genypterus blacodes]|uniref:WASH complex subunit 2A isoform X2 n=1 Tax=Genypterus blacodes TaxID=154954 RepID=UPI003F765CB0
MSGLPDGMANGLIRPEHLEKDGQIWERPWTLEEMRETSASWSLAADSGLLLFLQDFSHRMLSKTHEIEKQLDSLIRDTKATDSCLHSVFNDFLMLSNTQFIENRVYDEEVEEPVPKADALEKQPEQEKTREQKEAELIPKMQEAVNYGLKVLESAFEHLDIKAGNSDSEDEEVTDRVEAILEPKDLYVDRPLPYLIGSQAFMEQDDVGLGDLSSDEMSVDSERDSVIDSEDGKDADHSDEDFNQEEDEGHDNSQKKSSMLSYEEDEEDDEDSDIFGESDREDDENDDTKNTGPSSFADELAARIKGEPVSKPEGDRASLTSKKKGKGRKEPKPTKPPAEDDSDDMFKPPKMDDDEFSTFERKSGLFSGGKGLFDDDEDDLFSEASKPPVFEETKAAHERTESTAHSSEPINSGKKIPVGGVPIFPDNNLFSSGKDYNSLASTENGTPVPNQPGVGGAGGGGGLFDDEEEEDGDFFGVKSSKTSGSAGGEKPKSKKALDLFDEDDENGDIFSGKNSAPIVSQRKEGEQNNPPEKKMPAGAVSMFGPGTKNVLTEGLKKRQPPTSEDSGKSENGSAPDVGKPPFAQSHKHQSRGLFSDDEDAEVLPRIPKSESQPELSSQGKINKAPLTLFDDEEEEDLFASVVKTKPNSNQVKASTPQPSKAASSSLFSDDEEQWMSSSSGKPEAKAGGMKTSASAPSNLPSAKIPHTSVLFDEEEDDDLFAPTKVSSEKKPHRVALLFEDEGDVEEKGSLFGIKPVNISAAAPSANTAAAASPLPSPLVTEQTQEDAVRTKAAKGKPSEQTQAAAKSPEQQLPPSAPESKESKKKPAGAVSLFGGIDILANKHIKNPLDEADGHGTVVSTDIPSPNVPKKQKEEEKAKPNSLSLFDEEEEKNESSWDDSFFTPDKQAVRDTQPAEEPARTKSTGVFQDEELLFSQTQQKDNDPDVDLFATSGKHVNTKLSSGKPAAASLFADDDEDDLFSFIKPKALPPKVADKPTDREPVKAASSDSGPDTPKPAASPVKPKDPSSRIGKLQASLFINPNTLLPGAVPSMPGNVGISPGTAPSSSSGVSSSSLSPSPASTPHTDSDGGVSFDSPVQVTTLQSANKGRAKGATHRRPQSRAARQQSVHGSPGDKGGLDTSGSDPGLPGFVLPPPQQSSQNPANSPAVPALSTSSPSQPPFSEIPRPSVLSLPGSTNPGKKDGSKEGSKPLLQSLEEDDLFGSDSPFGGLATKHKAPSNSLSTKTAQEQASSSATSKKDKSTLPSIFDDHGDDLFKKVKPRSTTKKTKSSPFLESINDDEDIFGVSNSSTPTPTGSNDMKNSGSLSKQDIFKDEEANLPKVHQKHKEKAIDASIFDDNIDIFADLTDSLKPKEKSKKKGGSKSIFDDDMDDIFAQSAVKPVTKVPHKSKKASPSQETNTAADSADKFDDPLNALGGI